MLFDRERFERKFENQNLKIAFIGMSNIGKSFRTEQLQRLKNMQSSSIDNSIAEQMKKEGMAGMVEWMGYPFEKKYKEAEKEYLELENKITIGRIPEGKNYVLDTTGSFVYLEPETISFVQENFLVVNLDCSEMMLRVMIEEFFLMPKTIIWGDFFEKQDGEREIDALRRCYPALLRDRIHRYRKLADINIPGEISRDERISPERFWEILLYTLPKTIL
ncbi:hypothetical protein IPN35_00795 [Candidatus Peregrinibacteria bacterium]|nr:MAG: hypothetical protein IPN35_00795 [Candidatus Peregrinibacteria bacterium]